MKSKWPEDHLRRRQAAFYKTAAQPYRTNPASIGTLLLPRALPEPFSPQAFR
jgi:hypothetical protein